MAGLYIHIPFCRSKCAYCDFYSTPRTQTMEQYVDALLRELDFRKYELKNAISTIYLGGGTPSMLPAGLLERLMTGLRQRVDFQKLSEVTIEANPEDIDSQSISRFVSLGFNRISIGIQSFDSQLLSTIGRAHSADSAIAALEALSASGINFNADLIYGLPGQTPDMAVTDLKKLLKFNPPHVSAYLLSYEPGTRLHARLQKGLLREASEAEAEQHYLAVSRRLADEGFSHYEISNFAHPGYEAIHNSSYWDFTPYLGLGAAAHSFDGKVRRFNLASIVKYLKAIESGTTAYIVDDESVENRFNDYIICSLRTANGFSTAKARNMFGPELLSQFMANLAGLPGDAVQIAADDHDNLRIVIPESNWLTSDAVMRELIL